MTRPKPTTRKPTARARSRGAKARSGNGAAGREDFGKIIALIADAKERGVFDPKHRLRVVARPSATSTPGAPFVRIVAGAKTEHQQLRALEAAAWNEVALPADAFVVGEAAAAFRKMLWLNPGDNQGARFDLAAVEAGKTWEEEEMEGAER